MLYLYGKAVDNIMKRNFKQLLLNLVYPPKCVFCGARLSPKASRLVCSECSNALPYTKVYARCKRCGRPIARTQPDTCLQCRTQSRYITRKTAAFIYTGAAKSAVLAFKKERNAGNADTLADYIAEKLGISTSDAKKLIKAKQERRTLVQPRAGVPVVEEHIKLMQYLEKEGEAEVASNHNERANHKHRGSLTLTVDKCAKEGCEHHSEDGEAAEELSTGVAIYVEGLSEEVGSELLEWEDCRVVEYAHQSYQPEHLACEDLAEVAELKLLL